MPQRANASGRFRGAAAVLGLAALALGCEAVRDPSEEAARATLGRARMTEVALERVDARTFDFTARRDGATCRGTVVVTPRPERSTAAMQYACE
ncbi:MAG: hypothetical protein KF729_13725 [Sandaracinaceae bacterium]|nr:hypothetical protein [Sandaracinaceae bacterium]